ncbi:5'-nucleotidase [Myroides sp. JBRI-B21084]|uniref:5'-nucleotidase C-terminal domain-containing protein n=1 Tax=Myroides sp. JBRI-B21084 TaxID=3119977 RepID=UPI0026E240A9|nr:5'-nucleotidase [Paenimyroides cloacae]WKW45758.1 5'-nucleotidase [Paenimyroides cloacae]
MKYINLHKHYFKLFAFVFLAILFTNCNTKKFYKTNYAHSFIHVGSLVVDDALVNSFLTPYRSHIQKDLSKILAYNPQNLDKNDGKWQNKMTNFYADAILETATPVYSKQTGNSIDFCLLNYGGIRSTIAKGNITTRTAFDIMPFENNAVVLKVSGKVVWDLSNFIVKNKVAHPLSGIEIFVDKNSSTITHIKINNILVEKTKEYYLVTNDYLSKGGDNMQFLLNATENHSLNFKLRNMFIDYFTKIDTLNPSVKPRIIFE